MYNTGMTNKQKLFIKAKIDNPKASNADAAMAAYNTNNRLNASKMGHALMKKPEIIMALGQHAELFESAIVGTVRDWQDSTNTRRREIATQNAQYGHDKIFGRATSRVEMQTSVVKININLTGDGDDTPPPE